VPHDLGRVVATSSVPFWTPQPQLIPLSDGRLFLADPSARLLWLLDASLGNPRVVLDSAAGKANSFTARSWVIPFRGDSVLYFDQVSRGFVVVAPDGAIGRSMAPPDGTPAAGTLTRTTPGSIVLGYQGHTPTSSASLGLIYKVGAPSLVSRGAYSRPLPGEPDKIIEDEDSSYVVRMNFETRATDTLTEIARGTTSTRSLSATGAPVTQPWAPTPFPITDEFVVTSDGSVAVFRAREYRIEFFGADGKSTSGPRLPYPSRAISDADRARIVDSINATRRASFDTGQARRAADSVARGGRPPARFTGLTVVGTETQARLMLIDGKSVPDYYPPTGGLTPAEQVRHGLLSVRADADNNVWIRLRSRDEANGGMIWEVVNRQGELVDRVRVPAGQSIVGFARGGFAYVLVSEGGALRIEKREVRSRYRSIASLARGAWLLSPNSNHAEVDRVERRKVHHAIAEQPRPPVAARNGERDIGQRRPLDPYRIRAIGGHDTIAPQSGTGAERDLPSQGRAKLDQRRGTKEMW
jgi:hypothetical protein